jgi:hypothetical protein
VLTEVIEQGGERRELAADAGGGELASLEDRGRVRIGDSETSVRAGDYVALLAGPGSAHQTFNDSDAVLRYLCFSTMIEPDVNFYPESDKIGFFAGSAPGGDRTKRFLEGFVSTAACVDYWDGESLE